MSNPALGQVLGLLYTGSVSAIPVLWTVQKPTKDTVIDPEDIAVGVRSAPGYAIDIVDHNAAACVTFRPPLDWGGLPIACAYDEESGDLLPCDEHMAACWVTVPYVLAKEAENG